MSLNYKELFQALAEQPQVINATRLKANQLKEYLELRWPEVNDLSQSDRGFLEGGGDVVKVTEATHGTTRPVVIVTVRHPGAVAAQAKHGFVSKAVKDVS